MEKLLELVGITKEFPGVKALNKVNLNVYSGKVMGLLGENGAGKSTLMKVLSGVYAADQGSIMFSGEDVGSHDIRSAKKLGISIIHQELSLLPQLSIAENIFLDKLPVGKLGRIRWKYIYSKAEELLRQVQVKRDVRTLVKDLSISEQQLVEIAKALGEEFKVLIMDEPTDSLTDKEVENLFSIMKKIASSGKSIIYITHRLNEVFQICDAVTILRDGQFICESPTTEMDEEKLIKAMVGRELSEQFPHVKHKEKKLVLELKGVSNSKVQDVNLEIYSGEVLGFLGLMGAGRTELGKTIYGYYKTNRGEICYKGKEIFLRSPEYGVKNKILYVSEDRKTDGLVTRLSVRENMVLSALKKFENYLRRIDRTHERQAVESYIQEFHIKTPSQTQKVSALSGGNQQKVSIAKALMAEPEILILDEPTRGIDVGAKKEIYDLINRLKMQGLAIILISSEMPEILGLSDRIAVMCNKRITGVFAADETDQEQLLKYATNF